MEVITKILEGLMKIGDYLDYVLYGVLALEVMLFIIGAICACLNGELNASTRLAKRYLKGQLKNETAVMKEMPIKIKKLYKRARKTQGYKPSDFMTAEACVFAPYNASFASHFVAYMAYSTVILACIGGGIGYYFGSFGLFFLLAAGLGGVLTAVAALVARGVRTGAYNTYLKFIDKLDGDLGVSPAASAPIQETFAPQTIAYTEDTTVSEPQPVVEPAVPTFETETVYSAPIVEPVSQPTFVMPEPEPPVAPEPEPQPQPAPQPAPQAAPASREEAIAAARAAVEARRQQAAQAQAAQTARPQPERTAQPTARPQPRPQVQPSVDPVRAQAEAKAETATTEDVIARIEQISVEGAPLATMKEVALLLQKERSKPENKSPESQRKLNEALSKLLKAMSSAKK